MYTGAGFIWSDVSGSNATLAGSAAPFERLMELPLKKLAKVQAIVESCFSSHYSHRRCISPKEEDSADKLSPHDPPVRQRERGGGLVSHPAYNSRAASCPTVVAVKCDTGMR